MKWPEYFAFVRHGESEFNKMKKIKAQDPMWKEFMEHFRKNHRSDFTHALAKKLLHKYRLPYSDYDTPLSTEGHYEALHTGGHLKNLLELPDVIITSPYLRCLQTLEGLKAGWPKLKNVKCYKEGRVRERGIGIAIQYPDWKLFYTFHPEQKKYYESLGATAYFYYSFPQGESNEFVKEQRVLPWFGTITREFANKKVLVVSHHLTILCVRANLERLGPEEFLKLDSENPPKNCSITLYRGDPTQGTDGHLILEKYNETAP